MIPTVIYDANVLYPNALRDVLIRAAQHGLVKAHWTERILNEVFANLYLNRPDIDRQKLDRTRVLMNQSIRDVLVTGFEPLEAILQLPDHDDRHVLAAAIRARAQMIVTANVRDFPPDELSTWGIEATHPDSFLVDLFHRHEPTLRSIVQQIAEATSRPRLQEEDVIDQLNRCGAVKVAEALRR